MKLKRILTLCCMLTMALGMASSASAADYSFETSANPVYYGSTNYEDLYDAGYNYGARNQIDYDIPEIQYGLSQEFLETSLNNPYLSSGIQYGLSDGSATTVYPESDFSNSSIISGGSLIEVPYQPSVTITDLKQKDGSIGKVSIDRVSLSCKVYEGATDSSMSKGAGHYTSSGIYTGNIGLFGHNRGSHAYFAKLKNVKIGDIVEYKTAIGTKTYQVTFVGSISCTDYSYLNEMGDNRITLITCIAIYGVKFVLYDAGKNPIGEYATDQDGYIYIDDELTPGKYYIRELEAAEGYIRDEQYKTVYVEAGKCAQIEWENSAVTGQIQVRKYSADDNLVTGQRAGSALEGAVFEITQARSGKVVGYIVTDARGVAASDPLPLGRYFVTEVSAPKYYQLSSEKMEAEIEYPNQIIKLSAYNKSANLGVTIKKTGNREVQPGQVMSYDFSGIGNTSNVALNSFFWHDRIPTDATRAISVTTGTYNARLYYKVTFKTNLSDYRTLASNLLTSNNYSLSLNAATLGLAQGEYVTDVRFEFGTVPSGFASVVKPTMRVQVLGTVSNGYQIINRADVGGQYLNEWQTAKATWVTTVCRFNNNPLPKTGY